MATHGDTVPDLREMRPYLADEHSLTSTLTFNTKLNKHSLIVGLQGFMIYLKNQECMLLLTIQVVFLENRIAQ